jgi:hypothetical protein
MPPSWYDGIGCEEPIGVIAVVLRADERPADGGCIGA